MILVDDPEISEVTPVKQENATNTVLE